MENKLELKRIYKHQILINKTRKNKFEDDE